MELRRGLVIVVLLFFIIKAYGQFKTGLEVSNSTMVSSSEIPFWLWANRDGKIEKQNSFLNLSEVQGAGKYFFNDSNAFVQAGASLLAGLGNKSRYFQANQLFTGINLNNWEFNIGLYYNEEQFGGLSTTNGNIAQSRNARPHPGIGIRVADYKPVPLIGKYFFFKGEYEEGWLNDKRYVDKTHLHHKSLYVKLQPVKNFDMQVGLEHFVMWGGTSPIDSIGKLPGCSAYFQYVTGRSGDKQFTQKEQHNIAGNQYGTYQFLFTQQFDKFNLSLNFSHPFDDLSGMNLRNWPDNVIGLYLKFNDAHKLVSEILYEFTNTRNQGIDSLYRSDNDLQEWQLLEPDNYFNNHIYRSGVTYQKMAMVSPLFYPVTEKNGISRGFESNRILAHHIGAKGYLTNELSWIGMLTYIQHFGTWRIPYEQTRKQVSTLLEFHYSGSYVPFDVGLTFAGDVLNSGKNKLGFNLSVSKSW